MADELSKVLVFLETLSGSSPVGVLFSVEKKDGEGGLGFEGLLNKLGWVLALFGWCFSIVCRGGEVGGFCQGADFAG